MPAPPVFEQVAEVLLDPLHEFRRQRFEPSALRALQISTRRADKVGTTARAFHCYTGKSTSAFFEGRLNSALSTCFSS